MSKRPELDSLGNKELDNAAKQLDEFEQQIQSIDRDMVTAAPKREEEQQTKMSSREIAKSADEYIKPYRRVGSREPFNEKYRPAFNYDREMVRFIAENKENPGEILDFTTKPYPGMPVEFWRIPCNRPVWCHRHVAEQIKRKYHSRLVMEEKAVTGNSMGSDFAGTYMGRMIVESKVQRLDAYPAVERKSVFMGKSDF